MTLNLASALHFAFHIAMARLLGPAGYGAIAALLAILYVLNVFAESVQTVLARYTAHEPDPGAAARPPPPRPAQGGPGDAGAGGGSTWRRRCRWGAGCASPIR